MTKGHFNEQPSEQGLPLLRLGSIKGVQGCFGSGEYRIRTDDLLTADRNPLFFR